MNIEKTAIKTNFIRRLMSTHRSSGTKGALEYLSTFKDPTHALPLGKGNVPKQIFTQAKQKGDANFSRGVRTSMGNMAENFRIWTKDIGGKGVIGGTGQFLKNTGELMGRQIKGDTIKELKGPVVTKGNKKFIKSKIPFLKDREVISQTGRDSYLVKKRLAARPLGIAAGVSGPSAGLTLYALDKDKPQSERLQAAAKDTLLFTAGIPIGIAGGMLLSKDRKEQVKKKTKNKIKIGE